MESNEATSQNESPANGPANAEKIFRINFVSIILIILILIPFVFLVMKKEDAAKTEAATPQQMLEQVKQETEKNPTYTNYINLSLQYYGAGKFEECITACKEAIKLNPGSAIAYNNMCSAFNALKRWDEAMQACGSALALDPNMQLAKTNLDYSIKSKKDEKVKK